MIKMEKILRVPYIEADRPYSQHELEDLRKRALQKLRIGKVMVNHIKCGHFYFAKENGKKEQRLIETDGKDPGFCSVCWKLKKTPSELRDHAWDLIDSFQMNFSTKPEKWTHHQVFLEKSYYRWLYSEPDKRRKRNPRTSDSNIYATNEEHEHGQEQEHGHGQEHTESI